MQQPVGLVLDRCDHLGMAVTCGTNGDTGCEIKKSVSVHIMYPQPFTFFHHERVHAGVGRGHIGVVQVDEAGGLINDPVALKLAEDRFWLSLADSDALLWAKGLALGFGLDVAITDKVLKHADNTLSLEQAAASKRKIQKLNHIPAL